MPCQARSFTSRRTGITACFRAGFVVNWGGCAILQKPRAKLACHARACFPLRRGENEFDPRVGLVVEVGGCFNLQPPETSEGWGSQPHHSLRVSGFSYAAMGQGVACAQTSPRHTQRRLARWPFSPLPRVVPTPPHTRGSAATTVSRPPGRCSLHLSVSTRVRALRGRAARLNLLAASSCLGSSGGMAISSPASLSGAAAPYLNLLPDLVLVRGEVRDLGLYLGHQPRYSLADKVSFLNGGVMALCILHLVC